MPKDLLIVDDSGVMRKIVARSLRQAGFDIGEVFEGGDGVQGLSQLEQHPNVAVILSDLNMPNMDGLEFVKAVRDKGIQVPIIMITTESTESRVQAAKDAGANGYISKPFTPDKLQQELASFF